MPLPSEQDLPNDNVNHQLPLGVGVTSVEQLDEQLQSRRESWLRRQEEIEKRQAEMQPTFENVRKWFEEHIQQADDMNTLLHQFSEAKKASGFYNNLMPSSQRMMLRLATNTEGVTPTFPNDFHCRFYGDTKLEAAYYLDQVFESHDPVFFACRGLSTLLVNQMAIPPIRVSNLHVSLMLFMKVPKHRSICLENMYLEMCNNYDTDYVKEMHTLEYHFPDTLEEFGTGLDRYAILFDIFANVAKNDRVTSLVGSRLRAFKKAIMEQESMIAAGLSQDVDYLANLCNAVDAVINAHMEDCRKITQRDISMLDQLQVIVDGLYSNSHKSYLHSQCMMDHLPSRRMQAANDKKRAHEQMSIDVASHSSNKRQKTVVRRKKVYSKRVSDDLKLPAPFREIFSPKCYVHCPTVLRNGDKIPLCLNYFIKGKCANLKCNKSHDQPSRPALGRLKAFVKAQVDAYTRKSNRPAPIRSASVQIRSEANQPVPAPVQVEHFPMRVGSSREGTLEQTPPMSPQRETLPAGRDVSQMPLPMSVTSSTTIWKPSF